MNKMIQYTKSKNISIYFLFGLLLFFISCSKDDNPQFCSPLKAVELLINNPRIGPSKTETGYYEIVGENGSFIYFGYQQINLKSGRKMRPFYKTKKYDYYSILQRTSDIDTWKAEAMLKAWYLEKYPTLKYDSIKVAQTIEIKLLKNKITNKYDANCFGWIDFYFSKMEKSTEFGIDSAMTNYTIKKFDYSSLIEDGKNIKWIKSQIKN